MLAGCYICSSLKKITQDEVKENEEVERPVKAFMEIDSENNRLVHQGFSMFALEKIAEKIYDFYRDALAFVEMLPEKMRVSNSTF